MTLLTVLKTTGNTPPVRVKVMQSSTKTSTKARAVGTWDSAKTKVK